MLHRHLRVLQAIPISCDECLSWQTVCDFHWIEDASALSEYLIGFFKVKTIRLWEEEVNGCISGSVIALSLTYK